ncbi:PQQ-dependent dehydrogenase, methanol/ethanol family [Sandaracinobacter sp. RS1-74]|uniref:PQQ-dependent dehydrogenase, methanol/ethanol family n=1 Tax=Sandaracinobacteroides sayramensis TaxID=2913411 RepID=UPI001EDB03D4|nr:PQQ-dependent dehydrogenase, methanol/ethanol family [Sandaracinobacteroides sayramensis]MCG2841125.1 PQQ-dependent dehydrogenase, methanol/ethanol family [Sandaracinobacteroides sayramensis]
MNGLKQALLVAGAVMVMGGGDAPAGQVSTKASAQGSGRDWAWFGGNSSEDHFSPLEQINDRNIGRLGLAWSLDLDTFDSFTAPLAVDGVIYFGVGHSVLHAVDAVTGKLLWQYDPDVASQPASKIRMRAGWGIRGIAYKDGVLFTGTRDGRLIAVDAKEGKLLWSVETLDEAPAGYITGPPWVAGDNVVIGFGGADYAPIRGYVTAYNVKTGKKAWRFHIVPGNPADGFENKAMEMAAKTWTGEWWKFGGGGTVYNAMAYDARYNRIYLGTGNGWPWNQRIRSPGGGDNLFLSSIVALDADTGEYKWHYQTDPGNTWDFNNAMDIQLTDIKIGNKLRPVLIHAPKNGFFYVLDRENGKLLSAAPFAKQNWAERIDMKTGRPVEVPEARFPDGKSFLMFPHAAGAHGVQSMAYSPKTGLAYIPTMEAARYFADPANLKDWQYRPGMFINTGIGASPSTSPPPPPAKSSLVAWDVKGNRPAWEIPQPGLVNGGAIATGGGLVFQGLNDGRFVAYSAADGRELWTFDAQNGILGNAISYEVGGRQYVTVLTGYRSSFATNPTWDYHQQRRRVLTFALDGKAELPKVEDEETPVLDDPDFVVDVEKARRGASIYNQACVVCHGVGLVAGGAAPDLRKSGVALDSETFAAVVRDGLLMNRGMPAYGDFKDEDVEGLRHFVRQKAREGLPAASSAKAKSSGG